MFVKNKKDKPTHEIILDDSGFSVKELGANVAHIRWSDVIEIFAFKRDVLTYDLICLGFRVSDDGTFWEVTEDFENYDQLEAELKREFPGIRTDWFCEVGFPAFEANRTTIWGERPPEKL